MLADATSVDMIIFSSNTISVKIESVFFPEISSYAIMNLKYGPLLNLCVCLRSLDNAAWLSAEVLKSHLN